MRPSTITDIRARKISHCRGRLTVQVDLYVDGETRGGADVPVSRPDMALSRIRSFDHWTLVQRSVFRFSGRHSSSCLSPCDRGNP
jgi:hypothetical protein